MNLLAWGVDLVEEQLLASAGGFRLCNCSMCCLLRTFRVHFGSMHHPILAAPRHAASAAPYRTPTVWLSLLKLAGIPSRPNVAARPLRNIAEYSVNALKTGTLKDLAVLDK